MTTVLICNLCCKNDTVSTKTESCSFLTTLTLQLWLHIFKCLQSCPGDAFPHIHRGNRHAYYQTTVPWSHLDNQVDYRQRRSQHHQAFLSFMNLDFLCTWLLGNERLYSRLQRSQVSTQLHSRKAHSSEKSLYWWFNKFDNSIRLKQSTPPMKWKFDWHGSYFQINGIIFNMWEPQDVRKALKICISIDESCRMWEKHWKHAIQYMRDAGCEKSVEDTQSDSDLAADDGDFRDRPSLIWLDAIISAWGSWNEEDAWER